MPLVPGTAYSPVSIKMQISFLCMNLSRGGQWETRFFSLPTPSFAACFLERPLIAYYSWVLMVVLGEKLFPMTACCRGRGQAEEDSESGRRDQPPLFPDRAAAPGAVAVLRWSCLWQQLGQQGHSWLC